MFQAKQMQEDLPEVGGRREGEGGRKWEAGCAGDRSGIKPYLSAEGRALLSASQKILLGSCKYFQDC